MVAGDRDEGRWWQGLVICNAKNITAPKTTSEQSAYHLFCLIVKCFSFSRDKKQLFVDTKKWKKIVCVCWRSARRRCCISPANNVCACQGLQKKFENVFHLKFFFEARQVLRRKCENDFLLTKIIGYDFKLCLKIISYVTENIEDWQGLQWIAWKWFSHSLISFLNYLSRLAIKSSFNFNLI